MKRCDGVLALCGLIVLTGCPSRGPGQLKSDRMKYTTAVAASWEEQVLLNIVKIQYAETPTFIEVSSIVGAYETTGGFQFSGQYTPDPLFHEDKIGPGIDGRLSERPTITYSPVSGEKFARQLMVPVPASVVISMIQSGWRADWFMGMLVRALNGVRNRLPRMDGDQPADPEFERIVALMQKLQDAGALDFRTETKEKASEQSFMTIRSTPRTAPADITELCRLLGLKEGQTEVPLRFGLLHGTEGEVAISTMSMMQIMMALGGGVEIPPEHAARYAVRERSKPGGRSPEMRVRCSSERPANAYVAVQHRGLWFWMASDDLPSKTTLMAVCLLMKVLESGDSQKPVLTIPAR
jgi:hypothetical protein